MCKNISEMLKIDSGMNIIWQYIHKWEQFMETIKTKCSLQELMPAANEA